MSNGKGKDARIVKFKMTFVVIEALYDARFRAKLVLAVLAHRRGRQALAQRVETRELNLDA